MIIDAKRRSPTRHSLLTLAAPHFKSSLALLLLYAASPYMMASQRPPAGMDETKHHIVQSLFSRVDESGTADETLISYLKVYEDEGEGGQKTRYLMLAGRSGRNKSQKRS